MGKNPEFGATEPGGIHDAGVNEFINDHNVIPAEQLNHLRDQNWIERIRPLQDRPDAPGIAGAQLGQLPQRCIRRISGRGGHLRRRASLSPGHELKGAALVDSMDTTVWVPEGSSARIDEHGTFIMEVAR